MKKAVSTKSSEVKQRSRPALTPEARQNQMIAKAEKLAEKWLDEGTAPSQIVTHYLKLATVKSQLELEKIKKENTLLEAKAKAVDSSESSKALFNKALRAFRGYAGQDVDDEDE